MLLRFPQKLANFHLFLKVAISCGRKLTTVETKFSVIFIQFEERKSEAYKKNDKFQFFLQLTDEKDATTNNHPNIFIFCTFISPIYTFSLAGKITVDTPSQGTNWENNFNHISYKGENADFGGK